MESIPPSARGIVSGLLQAGYPTGYLTAALVYALLFPLVGWRGLFVVGAAPALLSIYVMRSVQESAGWAAAQGTKRASAAAVLKAHWGLAIYAILLMTAFNFFSHSTQDLYPTFLEVEHGFSSGTVGTIAVIYNIGAILGGLTFGSLSERIGRRRAIVAAALLSLPIVPLWAFSGGPVLLAVGAFLMQFMVQGAWGVIPAHLNELSPAEARGTFPGVVYQLGNLFAAANTTLQAGIAAHFYNEFSVGLAGVAACVALIVALLTGFGVEAKGVDLAVGHATFPQPARAGRVHLPFFLVGCDLGAGRGLLLRGAGGPDGLVVAERHRGAGPVGRGLGEAHGRPEMAQPPDRRVALDGPAVDVGLRDLIRHFLERCRGHLAAIDQPSAGLRQ
jgi:SHS family lactate transporter-like MFS transporter